MMMPPDPEAFLCPLLTTGSGEKALEPLSC